MLCFCGNFGARCSYDNIKWLRAGRRDMGIMHTGGLIVMHYGIDFFILLLLSSSFAAQNGLRIPPLAWEQGTKIWLFYSLFSVFE